MRQFFKEQMFNQIMRDLIAESFNDSFSVFYVIYCKNR